MSYLAPVDAPVSCGWQCHRDRDPPSSEPGTDYASAYGIAVVVAATGTVVDRKTSNSGAMGRYVTVALDDGRTVRYLHLSQVWVSIGQRVPQGSGIGASGASGYGNDWYYGPHVHTTLWPGPAWAAAAIDFELYVGHAEPTPEDPIPAREAEMSVYQVKTWDGGGIQGRCYSLAVGALYVCRDVDEANSLAARNNPSQQLEQITDTDLLIEFDARGIPRDLVNAAPGFNWGWAKEAATEEPPPPASHPLVTPAWVGGVILGLIGLVEVIRLVFDMLT